MHYERIVTCQLPTRQVVGVYFAALPVDLWSWAGARVEGHGIRR